MISRDPVDRPLRERVAAGEVWARGKDGLDYLVRPIRPDDAPAIMRGYDTLSDRSKWFRMLHAVPQLSEERAARFRSPDPASEFAVVVEGSGALAGEIIGGARVVDMRPGGPAEFAVTLREEVQGLGIARQTLETVVEVSIHPIC